MYKKVLYNIKKNKNMWGEGEGQYLNPNHSKCIFFFLNKKSKNFYFDRAGIRTHNLRERPSLLSTRLNTIIAITKYE